MKKITLFVLLSLTLILAACGAKEGTVTEEQLDQLEEQIEQSEKGLTKADVKENFGAPLEEDGNKWIYDLEQEDGVITLNLFFNEEELMGSTTAPKEL